MTAEARRVAALEAGLREALILLEDTAALLRTYRVAVLPRVAEDEGKEVRDAVTRLRALARAEAASDTSNNTAADSRESAAVGTSAIAR